MLLQRVHELRRQFEISKEEHAKVCVFFHDSVTCGVTYFGQQVLVFYHRKSKPVNLINTEHTRWHARTAPIANRFMQELEKIRANAKTKREALQEAEYHLQHNSVIQVAFRL